MTRIGILAGGGRLPVLLAENLSACGRGVHIVGIAGEADAAIARFAHSWVRWGEIGRIFKTLRQAGCGELVIAGAVRRPDLFKLRPDAGLLRNLPEIVRLLVGGDDRVLKRVVRFFEHAGFAVRGAHEVAPDLLAAEGPIGALPLGDVENGDARLGFAVRRALEAVDAGQAVVVAAGRVLAIEGVEGTDAMLERLAAGAGGRRKIRTGVLAKGPKPGQELRVDMPVVGPRTIKNALAAGLAGVVVEAGSVLIVDKAEMLRLADQEGCTVYGLKATAPSAAALKPPLDAPLDGPGRRGRVIGVNHPNRRDRLDLEQGLAAVEALAAVGVDAAVVVARSHVLAIEPGDGAASMLERVRALRQWGQRGTRRVGVFVCRAQPSHHDAEIVAILRQASVQGLAGVAVIGPARLTERYEIKVRLADELAIFLVVCGEA
jgi:UDP-2,3-diacylglucosamine hydrolase